MSSDQDQPGCGPGLRAPGHTALEAFESPRRWTARRIGTQIAGLILSLGLLLWVVSLALGEGNAESLQRLRDASASQIGAIVVLSLASIALNGLLFWVTLLPLKRVSARETIGINCLATFLSVLPFKISVFVRIALHHRLHDLRFKQIIAWTAAMGALALAVLLPLGLVSLWRERIDALWVGGIALSVGACVAAGIALGRAADRVRWLHTASAGASDVVRHTGPVLSHVVIRLMDMAVLSARFGAAAWIAGVALSVESALLLATTFFLLTVLNPFGTVGPREWGVAAMAGIVGVEQDALALVALLVTGAELLAAGVASVPFAMWLRPGRVLLGGRGQKDERPPGGGRSG